VIWGEVIDVVDVRTAESGRGLGLTRMLADFLGDILGMFQLYADVCTEKQVLSFVGGGRTMEDERVFRLRCISIRRIRSGPCEMPVPSCSRRRGFGFVSHNDINRQLLPRNSEGREVSLCVRFWDVTAIYLRNS
jgi:hypothetical protein